MRLRPRAATSAAPSIPTVLPAWPALLALLATLAVLLTVSACTPASDDEPAASPAGEQASSPGSPAEEILAAHDLAGLDGPALIDHLEALPVAERPAGLMASVRSDAVLLSAADGGEAALPLTTEEFYVSVAPFVDQTHECYFHSLTTCLGELSGEEFDVTFTGEDGTVYFEDSVQTNDNGFLGLWLPRDVTGTLVVTGTGGTAGTATLPVGTGPEDPTCVTTAQLV